MYFFDERKEWADRKFLISETGETVTYGEKEEFCEKMGQGTESGKLIFLFCTNTIGSVLGYFACLKKRMVPLLLDEKLDYNMIKNLITIYQPDYLYYPQSKAELSEKEEGTRILVEHGYCLLQRRKKEKTRLYENLALLLTTSGSTGSPKLVRQSYENIQSNAESIAEYLHLDHTERPITTLPMNYTYGLSILNSHALCGASILLTERDMFQKEFWDFFRAQKATSFGGVPFTYEMLNRLRFFDMDLPSLRTMTQAGGKLSKHLHRKFAQFAKDTNRKFVVMYGQTEATARMSYLPAEDALEKIGSIGIAIPGGAFSIEHGELVYRGKNVTLGYAGKLSDLAKGDERHGVLKTGDMAVVDEDGFYYIVGRKKRFLKILGKRINLDEVEQMLKTEYQDIQLACGGVDDLLKIYFTKDQKVDEEQLSDFLSRKIGFNQGVYQVVLIDHIPISSSGKVQYQKLEEMECPLN